MLFGIDIPREAEFDAVGFGLNAVDHLCVVSGFPERDTKPRVDGFAREPGGQAASAMVLLSRLGLRTKYVGKVGGDKIGAFSLESIRSEGVDTSNVITVPGVTTRTTSRSTSPRPGGVSCSQIATLYPLPTSLDR